jgi:Rieske 2Fe-2S family protein
MRTTLPARVYTDPVWFDIEMERIFAALWIAAGRAGEVDQPGAFTARSVAGASILIVRGTDGAIRAFHNVCRHRGTRVCDAEVGRFSGSIQCPYHAWTYGLDGRLLAAPQMDEVEGFSRGDHGLAGVACAEWDGHLFLNLGDRPAPLADQLTDLPARFAPWRMHELRQRHRVVYEVRANWKLIVQNYNECLHCPVIHPLLNRMHHYLGAENVPSTGSYCGGAMGFRDGVETLSTDGRRRRDLLPGLGERERTVVNYFAVFPNLLLTLHPDYMVTVTIWPQAPDRTRLVSEWHFHPDEMAKPGFVCEDAIDFWDRTNREDWAISEQAQLGISSRGYRPGPYSRRETQLWEFDQFILSRTADHGRATETPRTPKQNQS